MAEGRKPPSDEANINELLKPIAVTQIKNPTDRQRLLLQSAAVIGRQLTAARKAPQDFIQFALRTPALERIVLEHFHRFWLDRFQQSSRVQVEAAKSHGKTTNVVGFLTWQIGKHPDVRAKLFTQSAAKARQRLNVVASLVKNNKLVKLVFPHLTPNPSGPWHKEAIQVARNNTDEKEPTLEAKGIMGSVEGGRADLVLLDDICLVGSTPIITRNGILPIQDISIDDEVLNHGGTWSTVKHKHVRQTNNLLKLHVHGLPEPVVCTPNHPLLLCQERVAKRSNVFPEPSFQRADAIKIGKATRRWFMAFPIHDGKAIQPNLQAIWNDFELPNGTSGRHVKKARNLYPGPLASPDFWFMIGYWLAKGWLNKEGIANPGQVWLSIPHKHEHLAPVFQDICRKVLNRSMSQHPEGTKKAWRCVVSDMALANFLRTFRHADYTKELPFWIYGLPKALVRQMLAGYFTGDGSRGPRDRYRIPSVSLNLLFQMQYLLAQFNVTADMGKGHMNKLSTKPLYEMSMNTSFGAYILENEDIPGKYTWSKIANGHLLRPIRKVEAIQEETTVYNLTMHDITVHSYRGPLAVSHNCDYRTSLVYPQFRESIRNKLFAEILPMLDEGGRAISIGTPHHECLHPATRVLTSKGRKPVCELTEDDLLHTGPSQYTKPLKITKRPECTSMYEIFFIGHSVPQRLTGNHRVPTPTGLKYVEELKVGDMLPAAGFCGEWLSIQSIKLIDYSGPVYDIATSSGYFSLDAVVVHNSDAVATLRGNKRWESYQFPVGTPEDPFVPLWAKQWPREALKALHDEIGQMEYDRAYRLKEVTLGFQMITREHIKYYTAEQLGDPYALVCVQAYDLAISQKKGASFFAGVTLLYKPATRQIFVADAWHDRLDLHQQASAVLTEFIKWDANAVYVEETGYQQALRNYVTDKAQSIPELQNRDIPIRGVSPGSKSKELRLMETVPAFQAGRILFNPLLDSRQNPQVSTRGDLIRQLVDFHKAHDKDLADAFCHAVKGAESFASLANEEDYSTQQWDEGENIMTRLLVV